MTFLRISGRRVNLQDGNISPGSWPVLVSQSRVKATTVIESLDEITNALSSEEEGRVFLMKYQFLLKTAKETFNRVVVSTVALASHTATYAVFEKL